MAKCKHCLLGQRTKPFKNELTVKEIEAITETMGELLFLLPTGGEPFLRKDLPDIIKVYYENTKVRNVGIPTNGWLTDRIVQSTKRILEIADDLHLGIDISIDSLGARHDELRGLKGLFERAINTYNKLRELEKEYSNFNLNVETTISYYNQDHLKDLFNYLLHDLKVNNIFTLLVRGAPRDPASKFVDIKKYEEYNRMIETAIRNRALKGYTNIPMSDFINIKRIIRFKIISKMVKEQRCQVPCYAGRVSAILYSKGDVFPCELLDKKMGNIRDFDYDFKKIWFSRKANYIREYIKRTKCYCTHECVLTNNILFTPRMWPWILKELITYKIDKYLHRHKVAG
jgi:radical SAM protein with 4Fe4S-binding SPASM domain